MTDPEHTQKLYSRMVEILHNEFAARDRGDQQNMDKAQDVFDGMAEAARILLGDEGLSLQRRAVDHARADRHNDLIARRLGA